MTPTCSAVLALAAALLQDGAAGVGDPYYPRLGNGGYDVHHYALELDVDMQVDRFEGRAEVRAVATQQLGTFRLDLAEHLVVESVAVGGEAAAFERDGIDLVVRPETALAPEAEFVCTVAYAGEPRGVEDPAVPFEVGDGRLRIGFRRWDSGIFTLSQPSGASSLFPCNDHPSDKATYDLRVTVPRPWTVAANGELVSVEEEGEMRRFHFRPEAAMATYLVTVNVAELERHERAGPDGLPLNFYFPPERAEELLARSESTGEMIAFFAERFGPYPFESYGAVVAAEPIPGALETQTLPVYGHMAYVEPVIAHELAHQWFGNDVSPADWSEIWVSEGFAVYATALWVEHASGPEALDEMLRRNYRALASLGVPGPADPGVEDLFGASVYVRGGWVLHALRLSIGDEAFFRSLRVYHRRFAGGHATAEDFQQVVEECSGRDLDAVFDAWLRGDALPDVPSMGLRAEDFAGTGGR